MLSRDEQEQQYNEILMIDWEGTQEFLSCERDQGATRQALRHRAYIENEMIERGLLVDGNAVSCLLSTGATRQTLMSFSRR